MTDVMIDLETMSTEPNAVVLTIGAVKFNRRGPKKSLDKLDQFYRRIKIKSCLEAGLHISSETKEWWEMQGDEARYEAFTHKDRVLLVQALKEFSVWFRGARCIWSHGATFDCVILEQAYKACDIPCPWMFWAARDTRTLFDLAGIRIKDFPIKVEHHALYDAFRQVLATKASIKKLKL
tara:strand:+ start:10358 stop:10894 length:537 start_codon:yes stop_codon:yes gene_type:complete